MHSRRRFALLACTAALVALLAPSASAGPIVPQRNYTCHSEQGRVIGTLRIKSQTDYKYRGKGGEYVYKSAGDFLHFQSGPLLSWLGRLRKSGGDPMIRLTQLRADGKIVKCLS